MKKILKTVFYMLPLYCQRNIQNLIHKRELKKWIQNGRPVPPPHLIKQLTIKEYQKKYDIQTLVETGTYLGDMIVAQLPNFIKIISIELSEELYYRAVKRFRRCSKVNIIQGDSGKVLHNIIHELKTPAIFWLDGHYSAGITAKGEKNCPIYGELEAIFVSPLNHILLIDDARCFDGSNDYPTIGELQQYFIDKNIIHSFSIKDDVIRIVLGKIDE